MPIEICKHKKVQGFQKGNKINLGRKQSKAQRENLSERNIRLGIKPPISKKGRYHNPMSEDSKKKMREAQKKVVREGRCHFWKGGAMKNYSENQQIRKSPEYLLWRSSVFERDHYTCRFCGARNGNGKTVRLEADHIKQFALFPELRFAIDNGRTLCVECHRKTDTYGNYKVYRLEK